MNATPALARSLFPSVPWARDAALVALGVVAMAIAAKVKVPFWPVPITLQTFVVLTVGATYGFGLGALTMLAYLAVGAMGLDVFTGSSVESAGLDYMLGGTGGYLIGFVLATALVGWLAERGWDRSLPKMLAAMLAGSALIYAIGVPWLADAYGKPLAWAVEVGMTPFLLGDALKLALAAALVPALWAWFKNRSQ